MKAQGKVRVVAPEIDDRIRDMAASHALEFEQREFVADDLQAVVCVIAATDNIEVNREISELAQILATVRRYGGERTA